MKTAGQMDNKNGLTRASRRLLIPAVSLAVLLNPIGTQAADALYALTDLGTLGGSSSYAYGINDNGDTTGYFQTGGNYHAFLYSGGVMSDLGTLGGQFAYAYGINNQGQVVGYSSTSTDYHSHAFLYSTAEGMKDLGTLSGANTYALSINDSGQFAGYASLSSQHAFLYAPVGGLQDLGTFGGNSSAATCINAASQIAGYYVTRTNTYHGFLYSGGKMSDFGNLPGTSERFGIRPNWINSTGQIVGYTTTNISGGGPAFLYQNGTLVQLGGFGGAASAAWCITHSGQVFGASQLPNGAARACLWSGGVLADLNSLITSNAGWAMTSAYCANRKGQIVGVGTNSLGQYHALLLTPFRQLYVASSGNDLLISWFFSTNSLALYKNPTMSPAGWAAVTNTPAITNGQNQVIIKGPLEGSCFYRLQSN